MMRGAWGMYPFRHSFIQDELGVVLTCVLLALVVLRLDCCFAFLVAYSVEKKEQAQVFSDLFIPSGLSP